tara:strand:- start:12 stop:548 length:537 start_codon:yes stop_codon:yes gene_type:complete
MKVIDSFISDEEAQIIGDYIVANEDRVKAMGPDLYQGTSNDSLTGRWQLYNWLSNETVGSILIPKLTTLFPNLWIRMWANIFRKGEGIGKHVHDTEKDQFTGKPRQSGNLFLRGPEDTATHYITKGALKNKVGTLVTFDSHVPHWVEPNSSETARISMAFDTVEYCPDKRTFIPLRDA